MRVKAFHMFMIGMVLVFPYVVGYSVTRVTKLKRDIEAFHALFTYQGNPMFENGDQTIMGFKDPDLFKKDRRDSLFFSVGNEDKNCEPIDLHVNSDLKDSSTCPWYTKLNYDENRIPTKILVAECRCVACTEGCCKPLILNLPVTRLYRDKYVPTIEPVSVACLCQHMTSADKKINCGAGRMHKPTYNKTLKHRKKMRRTLQLRRQKIKKKRKNVTIEKKRQLIWWRYKNCSYYRYCKL
ncbi:uncharacterized protein LOC110457715 [Mizuhopecten yessoensis]|uniref:uncharacterized protein LOC110457715 n=1 Tax=Mizuhopecten yessoensis TaxID=6573 RepID=UPI000B45D708|nr:uncharacterized protein LOC110457715 [Mizuhopecten yessoensis]